MRTAQWILLTALGLTAGVFSALVLGGPIEAVVGMVLVTPLLTGLASPVGVLLFLLGAGSVLGAATAQQLRSGLQEARRRRKTFADWPSVEL